MKNNRQTRKDKISLLRGIAGGILSKEDIMQEDSKEVKSELLLDAGDGSGDLIVPGTDKRYTAAEVQSWRDNPSRNSLFIEL